MVDLTEALLELKAKGYVHPSLSLDSILIQGQVLQVESFSTEQQKMVKQGLWDVKSVVGDLGTIQKSTTEEDSIIPLCSIIQFIASTLDNIDLKAKLQNEATKKTQPLA